MSREFLRQLPLFAGLSDDDLARLYDMAETVEVVPEQVLVAEGSPGDALYVVLDGKFEVTVRSGERELVIAGCQAGDVIGEISLLEQSPRTATVRALVASRLLRISRETFEHLLARSPASALAMLRTVNARLRNTQVMLRQSEKMASLGTLAAGLAHELNNPAAAVKRSSALLRAALPELARAGAALNGPEALLDSWQERLTAPRAAAGDLGPLELSDREGGLQDWLEELGAEEAWESAPALAAQGWTAAELGRQAAGLDARQALALVRWLVAAGNANALVEEVNEGAARISEIVQAVKSYSYLDQAPVQQVDLRQGIENALLLLQHKLKVGVAVRRDFAPDLPRIEAYSSELNQVWTNLIDNAADALDGKGEITIRAYPDRDDVVVEICDNGPGIPPAIRERIFEAFFTTKPMGQGTGLGLHISYNIVVNQHQGQIEVESVPGQTTFRVRLPQQLSKR